MDLESRIRTAIKSGGLLSVALYRSASDKEGWVCTYLNDSGKSRQSVTDKDPIAALEKGITPLRQKGEDVPPAKAIREKKPRGKVEEDEFPSRRRRRESTLAEVDTVVRKNARRRDMDDVL